MKILHIITNLDTGGAEMALYNFLSGRSREHSEPMVVSLIGRGTMGARIEAVGVPVQALNLRQIQALGSGLRRLRKIVRTWRPQLIQGWMYHGNLAASLASLLAPNRVPVLWNIRHTVYDLRDEKPGTARLIRLGARLSHRPAWIIYNAKISTTYHEALGYASVRRSVIPNGFDLTRFAPSAEARNSVRMELGINPETPLIGLIGRFHPMKDHHNFLQAATLLARKRPEVHFLLAGQGVESKNEKFRQLVTQEGLTSRLHLLGERQDIPRLTAALDVAALTSWSEAFPNVIGEAMACGVPCVVTDVGDAAWIVGETGIVVPPRDSQALAAAWDKMLALDTTERTNLGAQARRRIGEHFSLTQMVCSYEQLYEKVIHEACY